MGILVRKVCYRAQKIECTSTTPIPKPAITVNIKKKKKKKKSERIDRIAFINKLKRKPQSKTKTKTNPVNNLTGMNNNLNTDLSMFGVQHILTLIPKPRSRKQKASFRFVSVAIYVFVEFGVTKFFSWI